MMDCVETMTYSLQDIMTDPHTYKDKLHDGQMKEISGNFTSEITWPFLGKCHRYRQEKMNSKLGNITLPALNKSLDYWILIHDPDFFFLTTNPNALPGVE